MILMRVFKTAVGLILALAVGAQAETKTYNVDRGHSEVGFQIRHLVGKVRGRFNDFNGEVKGDLAKPDTASVAFTIKTASINTDNQNRDNHLRGADFFDAEKHPEITFKSEKIVAKSKDEFEVTGPFTMHGVTKPVTLPVKVTGTAPGRRGEIVGIEINTVLNRKDYGIVWNRVLDTGGVQLGDDVTVNINLELNEARAEAAPAAEKKDAPKEKESAQPAAR
jgi:polyisoprenoid-binding protein YceI